MKLKDLKINRIRFIIIGLIVFLNVLNNFFLTKKVYLVLVVGVLIGIQQVKISIYIKNNFPNFYISNILRKNMGFRLIEVPTLYKKLILELSRGVRIRVSIFKIIVDIFLSIVLYSPVIKMLILMISRVVNGTGTTH